MTAHFTQLQEVSDFHHKLSYVALNRHFWQTRVRCWRSVCRCSVVHFLQCLWCVYLVALLDFIALVCALKRIQMYHQMGWQFKLIVLTHYICPNCNYLFRLMNSYCKFLSIFCCFLCCEQLLRYYLLVQLLKGDTTH